MPPIGILVGGVDFMNLAITLKEAVGDTAAVTVNYGKFIQSIIDFIIIAFAIFLIIKAMNTLQKKRKKRRLLPRLRPMRKICSGRSGIS